MSVRTPVSISVSAETLALIDVLDDTCPFMSVNFLERGMKEDQLKAEISGETTPCP